MKKKKGQQWGSNPCSRLYKCYIDGGSKRSTTEPLIHDVRNSIYIFHKRNLFNRTSGTGTLTKTFIFFIRAVTALSLWQSKTYSHSHTHKQTHSLTLFLSQTKRLSKLNQALGILQNFIKGLTEATLLPEKEVFTTNLAHCSVS